MRACVRRCVESREDASVGGRRRKSTSREREEQVTLATTQERGRRSSRKNLVKREVLLLAGQATFYSRQCRLDTEKAKGKRISK